MQPSTRKVVQRSPAHTVRLIHLPHLQPGPVEADSSVERDFIHIAALYPGVERIEHQPFKLVWEDASYTPDFLVRFEDRSHVVVEVKPTEKVAGYAALFDKATKKLGASNMPFLIATDEGLREDGMAERARAIRRYAKTGFPLAECDRLLKVMENSTEFISFSTLISCYGFEREFILHTMAFRRISSGRGLRIDEDAPLRPTNPRKKEITHAIHFTNWINGQAWHADAGTDTRTLR